jgi:hypothetical protein
MARFPSSIPSFAAIITGTGRATDAEEIADTTSEF